MQRAGSLRPSLTDLVMHSCCGFLGVARGRWLSFLRCRPGHVPGAFLGRQRLGVAPEAEPVQLVELADDQHDLGRHRLQLGGRMDQEVVRTILWLRRIERGAAWTTSR